MTAMRQVLAAANCPETVGRLEELLLSTRQLALEQVGNGSDALARAKRRRFELIMTEFPLADLHMKRFLSRLRARRSTSREAHVVILTGSIDRQAIESLGPKRLAGVDICTNIHEALRAVARCLYLGDRLSAELRVAVVGTTEHYNSTQLAQTRNISASGMLLDADPLLPVGTVAPIAIELSSDEPPIRGGAEVVRHTDPERENVTGMGMRFTDLLDEDRRRLSEFVAKGLTV
jgi:CheY-like chemotaxis protein